MNTHDIQLARKLYQFLNQGDILLGDRAFCAYADLLSLKNLGCDAVFRKHQSRTTSIRKGKIIGDCDKLVTWYKPKICPKGLSKDEFVALPPSLTVREIYYYIVIPGFRTGACQFNHYSLRYNHLFPPGNCEALRSPMGC